MSVSVASRRDVSEVELDRAPRWPLAGARIVIGFLWAQQILWKMPPDFGCGPRGPASIGQAGATGLCDWVGREIAMPLIPAYATFLQSVVVPNFAFFGWMTWLLEAFIAVSLLLGVVTRLGGLAGVAQAANLWIGLSGVEHEWYWTYLMLLILCGLFALTAAGRVWGVDRVLARRAANGEAPAWLKLAV
jgi:thiosulfate dehydrogenase (quinone) large subunit